VRAAIAIGTALATLAGGCASEPAQLPPACSAGPQAVLRALGAAPGDVRLTGGTLLSECVARASDDGELQQVGFTLSPVADALREQHTERAALRLGFLVGAVRRGARRTNGIHGELVRRMERRVGYDDPALLAAARRGAAAGEDHG
jgi:hypothetical protein